MSDRPGDGPGAGAGDDAPPAIRSLAELASARPDDVGWRWPDLPRPERWTFADAAGRVGGVVTALRGRGVAPGARLAVVGPNHPAFVLLREAATAGGWVLLPIGDRLAPPERDWIVRNAEPALVLGDPALAPGECAVEDWSWVAAVDPAPLAGGPLPGAGEGAAQLLYTSGSSGRPKGVLRPRAGDRARILQSIRTFGLGPGDRHLVAGPLYHSGPSIFSAIHRALGATQTVLTHFDARRVAALLTSGEVRTTFMVPTMWRMVLEAFRAPGAPAAPARLRRAWTGGSHLDDDTRLALLERLGEGVLWEFYGTTETGTVTVLPPERQRSHLGTVGFPAEGAEVSVRDAGGGEVPAGEVGRVYVRSPTLMLDYHRGPGSDPALKADRRGEFLSVGDRGFLAEDGALTLLGREGGMIVTGGINVYPEEVEAALRGLEGVREAVVFGLPDPLWGTAIACRVELVLGASRSPGELARALRREVAGYKVPKRWSVGPIPRTFSQKVVRDPGVLAALLAESVDGV